MNDELPTGAGPDTTGTARNETEHHDIPRIYVASLADYNAGVLHGAWIDPTADLDEINGHIAHMLAASPTTPHAEEYAIHDYEHFGTYRPDEYDHINWLHAVAVGIAEHGSAFAAWATHCDHDPERLAQFDDAYLGDYDTAAAFANELIEDSGLQRVIDEHIPDSLASYVKIDINALARDLELGGDITTVQHEHGVWIFDPRI